MTIAPGIVEAFKQSAAANNEAGIETLGYLLGKRSDEGIVCLQHVYMPRQNGDKVSCNDIESAGELIQHCEEHGLHVGGWIHTHPLYTPFFSSVDQHVQFSGQNFDADYIGIVVGYLGTPKGEARFFQLTQAGMGAIAGCTETGHHVHSDEVVMEVGPHDRPTSNFFEEVSVKVSNCKFVQEVPQSNSTHLFATTMHPKLTFSKTKVSPLDCGPQEVRGLALLLEFACFVFHLFDFVQVALVQLLQDFQAVACGDVFGIQ